MSGAIVVDYEELHRMSHVWAAAAESLVRQAMSVASITTEPGLLADAVFDPLGAARAETAIVAAAAGPHGLAALATRLAADGFALEAVVVKERLVDDFPSHQLVAFDAMLVTATLRFPFAPVQQMHDVVHASGGLAGAMIGYLSPFAEPLLTLLAPSAVFKADAAMRQPVAVEPILGLPLSLVAAVAPEGQGSVSASRFQPVWAGTPSGSLAGVLRRVAGLERFPDATLAIDEVVGGDGITRYVVELPGIRHLGVASDPQDLSGAVNAMVLPATSYTRCVSEALDAVGAPRGAQVLLVGHSEGGIVAMDLAADPAFNGGRVKVTDVLAAGSPISSKQVVPGSGTRVFSVENVDDMVTHLDAVDSATSEQTPQRLTYQFADDRHSIGATHSASLYADHLAALADSPNPLLHGFEIGVAPYLTGETTTTAFALADAPPAEPVSSG